MTNHPDSHDQAISKRRRDARSGVAANNQMRRRWINATAFLEDTELLHPHRMLWAALVITALMPFLIVLCLWLGAGDLREFTRDLPMALMLGEPILLAGLGAWEMRRPRSGSRRLLLMIGVANAGFGILFGALMGNVMICPLAAATGVAIVVLLGGHQPRRWGTQVAYAIVMIGTLAVVGALAYGRSLAFAAGEAWHSHRFEEAADLIDRTWPIMTIKGAGDLERASFAARAAEANLRIGKYQSAREWVKRAREVAEALPVSEEFGKGISIEQSLAWRITHQGLPIIAIASYQGEAWGEGPFIGMLDPSSGMERRTDVLNGAERGEHDRMGWSAWIVFGQ